MIPSEAKNEVLIEVRCVGCRRVLFEAAADATGVIVKRCERCRQLRRIRLPLTRCAIRNTISVDASAVILAGDET